MTTEQAFLADICSNPDDDGVRLIYADWLTERDGPGDVERAELIRVQCALELTSHTDTAHLVCLACALNIRERGLISLVQDRLRQEWRSWADERKGPSPWWAAWQCRRGFVERITLAAEDWCRYAERLCAMQPIREVTLTTRLQIRMQVDPDPSDLYVSFHAVRLEDPAFARRPAMPWVERVPFQKPAALARWLWPGITFHGPDFPEASA